MSSRIVPLIIVNVVTVLIMAALIMAHIIPLYPGMAIFYPLLLAANVVWILAHDRRGAEISDRRQRVPKSLWIIATIFSLAGIVAVFAYLRSRTMPLGVQAAVAVLLVGYIWFIIYRLRSHHDRISN